MDEYIKKFLKNKIKYKCIMANTSAIWQRAAHTTCQLSSPSCSTGVISRGLTKKKKNAFFFFFFFCKKVRRMDYQHKNNQIKRTRGLCRKTGFLHSDNSGFIPSCQWIYLLHRHSTHRHYHCHWSSSLPFTFIVTFTLSVNRLFRCCVHRMNRQLDG